MPNYFSPGVYTVEKDMSTYPVAPNASIVGIVGFASKGPTNEATLITSPENLIKTFGEPSESLDGQGLEGALEILEATNSIYFVRAAGSTALEASTVVSLGTCPTVGIRAGQGYGDTANLYLKVQVGDSVGVAQFSTPKEYSIPAGTVLAANTPLNYTAQVLALRNVIGGDLDADKVGFFSPSLTAGGTLLGSYAGSAAYISVSAYSDSTFTTGVSALYPVHANGLAGAYGTLTAATWGLPTAFVSVDGYTSSLKVFGATIPSISQNTAGVNYLVKSLYPGNGYNTSSKADGTVTGNSIEIDALGGQNVTLTVNDGGTASETFKVSLASGTFVEDFINVGLTNPKSEFIKGYLVSGAAYADMTATEVTSVGFGQFAGLMTTLGLNAATPVYYGGFVFPSGTPTVQGSGLTTINSSNSRFGKFIDGTFSMVNGTNGTGTDAQNTTAIIGSPTETPKSGIYALDYDDLNISIALVPGKNNQTVQNALITLAESSQNFISLVSPPYGAINTAQEALDWTNGRSETRTAAINSSYAAVHWPWVKVFSVFDGVDRWYDPSIFAARQMCYTDGVSDPWVAPAGFRRGRLTKPTEVEVSLNQGDRDSLYSGGNVVNPIVSFPQAGITIFGQRTAQRIPTALDRINVRRLMIYLRKAILNSTQSFVFEPNDAFTWEAIRDTLNPLLEDIRSRRGIINYSVVCDETTNTPVRVDRNELWCKVIIQPTKAAEVVVFELNVTNQSAKIGA
jgi:phage tail sheath protein FI